jgi:hypothetical protein
MKRRVNVGKPFDDEATLTEAKTRSVIVYAVVGLATLFLVGAGIIGLIEDQYSLLQAVWSIVGPIYGGIAGHYFRSSRRLE